MRITAIMAASLVITLPHLACADAWYTAEFCDPLLGACSIDSCELSDESPATIYERNEGYGDAKLLDQGGDRVDVIAQGARLVFFRTVASCKKFVAEQIRIDHERKQEEQRELDKYR